MDSVNSGDFSSSGVPLPRYSLTTGHLGETRVSIAPSNRSDTNLKVTVRDLSAIAAVPIETASTFIKVAAMAGKKYKQFIVTDQKGVETTIYVNINSLAHRTGIAEDVIKQSQTTNWAQFLAEHQDEIDATLKKTEALVKSDKSIGIESGAPLDAQQAAQVKQKLRPGYVSQEQQAAQTKAEEIKSTLKLPEGLPAPFAAELRNRIAKNHPTGARLLLLSGDKSKQGQFFELTVLEPTENPHFSRTGPNIICGRNTYMLVPKPAIS